jgi:Cdc6-like AAA superfamily ATPase
VIVIDEMDVFEGCGKENIEALLHIPLFSAKTVLVGITNSPKLHSVMVKYYEKQPSYIIKSITFSPYVEAEILSVLKAKLMAHFNSTEKIANIIKDDALRGVAKSVALNTGDMRIAFDTIKNSIINHAMKEKNTPVSINEVSTVLKFKHCSKLSKTLQSISINHKIMIASIFANMQESNKETFMYKQVYDKFVELVRKLELEVIEFDEFCEAIKILEFYGIVDLDKLPKPGYTSIVTLKLNYR